MDSGKWTWFEKSDIQVGDIVEVKYLDHYGEISTLPSVNDAKRGFWKKELGYYWGRLGRYLVFSTMPPRHTSDNLEEVLDEEYGDIESIAHFFYVINQPHCVKIRILRRTRQEPEEEEEEEVITE